MQNTNICVAEKNQENALLKKQLQEVKEQLQNLKSTCSDISKEKDELKDKYTSDKKKYIELEIAYDKEFANMNAILLKQKSAMRQVENQREQLKAAQQEKQEAVAQLETELAELKLQNTQLEAHIEELISTIEQYKQETVHHNELKDELQEQAATLQELKENNMRREAELKITVKKLKNVEERNFDLQKANQQLSIELSGADERMSAEINQHKLKIDELQNQNVKLVSDAKRYQSDIAMLAETNNQLTAANAEAADVAKCQLAKITNESIQLKLTFEELQQKHEDATNTLSAQNAELAQQLQELKKLYETNIVTLEAELQQMDARHKEDQTKFVEMERQKNITIAELTFKVNQIKNLSALPVKIARIISSQQDEQPNTKSISATSAPVIHQAAPIEDSAVESMENVAAEISASNTSVPQRRRRQAKRSFVPHYKSDFNTDTDDNDKDSDWERPCPKMVKTNRLGYQKTKVSCVDSTSYDTMDAFDKLKATKN
ncbi:paramyosin [Drosophila hydei]|uniref:Paramyosin n=1 Tax=Drosophila hydei TaxID=7224 RepID=A0A6J1MC07_DROHY|nr:paramyosin [Drosophila hydei]